MTRTSCRPNQDGRDLAFERINGQRICFGHAHRTNAFAQPIQALLPAILFKTVRKFRVQADQRFNQRHARSNP